MHGGRPLAMSIFELNRTYVCSLVYSRNVNCIIIELFWLLANSMTLKFGLAASGLFAFCLFRKCRLASSDIENYEMV